MNFLISFPCSIFLNVTFSKSLNFTQFLILINISVLKCFALISFLFQPLSFPYFGVEYIEISNLNSSVFLTLYWGTELQVLKASQNKLSISVFNIFHVRLVNHNLDMLVLSKYDFVCEYIRLFLRLQSFKKLYMIEQ